MTSIEEWDIPTLALVWDSATGAIVAGADRLESLSEVERTDALAALSQRIRDLAVRQNNSWLVATACFMVDDLHKSYYHRFRWSSGVADYLGATAGVFLDELARRGIVLHYVVDNTLPRTRIGETLSYLPAVFSAAGLVVASPQLMGLEMMHRDHGVRDVTALARYRNEGHHVADLLIARCHEERRSSVYLNLDLDDDTPALSLDAALSQVGTPGTIVVFRNEPPSLGSVVKIVPPPGIAIPNNPTPAEER